MLFAGIDWSDSALDYHLRTGDGKVLVEGQVEPNREGLAKLFTALEAHATPAEIGIAVETAHGAWVQALLDREYRIYPVNPKSVARFREALSVAGNKSDKIDRKTLALFLASGHQDLRPLKPDAPEIIVLRIACQDRVRLVEERTAKINELQAIVKVHYPAFVGFFGEFDSQVSLEFLQAFPSQLKMQALTPRRLRNWLRRHGYGHARRLEAMEEALRRPALPVPEHVQKVKVPLIQYLSRSLIALKAEIAQREKEITERLDELPEADWVCSLPGAGSTLAPSILACVGRDPDRFASADDARALMGTAPVTKASGKSRVVHFRHGCWKFARRTMQLFADQSRHQSDWAQAFYERCRARGQGHHAALRALAHKWLKIILAMKRNGTRYDESLFANSQRRYLLKAQADNA